MRERFQKFASWVSEAVGSPFWFALSVALTVAWLASGPFFHFGTGWNFAINSSTTVITWLLVTLLQNVTNRDQAEILALLREIAEDLPQVDERRARARAEEGDTEG